MQVQVLREWKNQVDGAPPEQLPGGVPQQGPPRAPSSLLGPLEAPPGTRLSAEQQRLKMLAMLKLDLLFWYTIDNLLIRKLT